MPPKTRRVQILDLDTGEAFELEFQPEMWAALDAIAEESEKDFEAAIGEIFKRGSN